MNYDYRFRLAIESIINSTIGPLFFQYEKKKNLFSWYYNCLVYTHVTKPLISPKYHYYEFGVADGGSMELYILALKKFCRDYHFYFCENFFKHKGNN